MAFTQMRLLSIRVICAVSFLAAVLIIIFAAISGANAQPVVINEVSPYGTTDWIELYNTSHESVAIDGWTLRDDVQTSAMATMSGVIPAKSFKIIELGSRLNANKDSVTLFNREGVVVDSLAYGPSDTIAYPPLGKTIARNIDGIGAWQIGEPTKGLSNSGAKTAISAPANGWPHENILNSKDVVFSWQPVTDAVMYDFRMSNSDLQTDGALYGATTQRVVEPRYAWHGIPDDSWFWQVRAISAHGDVSSWSEIWHTRIDTEQPSIVIENPAQHATVGKEILISGAITDLHGLHYFTYELRNSDDQIVSGFEPKTGDNNSGILARIMVESVQNGKYTIRIVAEDMAGNRRIKDIPVTIDRLPPAALIEGAERVALHSQSRYKITTNKKSDVVGFTINGVDARHLLQESENNTWTFDFRAEDVGNITMSLILRDAVGNSTSYERVVAVYSVSPTRTQIEQIVRSLTNITAQLSAPIPVVSGIKQQSPAEESLRKQQSLPVLVANTNDVASDRLADESSAIVPSKDGWILFGVAWYWWFCIVALPGVIVYVVYKKVTKKA